MLELLLTLILQQADTISTDTIIQETEVTESIENEPAEPTIPIEVFNSHDVYRPGDQGYLAVIYYVPERYHLTSIKEKFLFINPEPSEAIEFGKNIYPSGETYKGETIYRSKVKVLIPFKVKQSITPDTMQLRLTAGYQLCSEFGAETCFMPNRQSIMYQLRFGPEGTEQALVNELLFTEVTGSMTQPRTFAEKVEKALSSNLLIAFLLVFIGGILSSFTPCVYPVIPITIGFIGGSSGGSKKKGFILSLFFVLGLAIIYSVLGVAAAASGTLFGSFAQHPVVLSIIVLIFVAMGLSMFGFYDIQIPSSLQAKLNAGPSAGIIGSVFMGGVAGIVAAPCVGPIIIALLAWIAQTGNLVLGFTLMFAFSLGLGMLFLVIGTFSGAIQSLPTAGAWMETVKKIFGVLIIGAALFFAKPMIPDKLLPFVIAAVFLFMAIIIGQWYKGFKYATKLNHIIALVLLLLGAWLTYKSWPEAIDETHSQEGPWIINGYSQALERAKQENKPLVLDFWAEWCVACNELDHQVWSTPELEPELARFVAVKFDFTKNNKWSKDMQEKFHIKGMPTVIFMTPNEEEIGRFTGFKPKEEVLKIMQEITYH